MTESEDLNTDAAHTVQWWLIEIEDVAVAGVTGAEAAGAGEAAGRGRARRRWQRRGRQGQRMRN